MMKKNIFRIGFKIILLIASLIVIFVGVMFIYYVFIHKSDDEKYDIELKKINSVLCVDAINKLDAIKPDWRIELPDCDEGFFKGKVGRDSIVSFYLDAFYENKFGGKDKFNGYVEFKLGNDGAYYIHDASYYIK
jgi:hypothetical protein